MVILIRLSSPLLGLFFGTAVFLEKPESPGHRADTGMITGIEGLSRIEEESTSGLDRMAQKDVCVVQFPALRIGQSHVIATEAVIRQVLHRTIADQDDR